MNRYILVAIGDDLEGIALLQTTNGNPAVIALEICFRVKGEAIHLIGAAGTNAELAHRTRCIALQQHPAGDA